MPKVSKHAQTLARVMLVALLAALPVIAGKLFDWQTLLVALLVFVAAILFFIGQVDRPQGTGGGLVDYALVGVLLLALVSTAQTVYLHASLLALGQLYSYFMVFWLARSLLGAAPWRRAGMAAVVVGGTVAAVWGLREYTRTVAVAGQVTWRIYGPFFNPNLLAGYLLLALPVAVAVIWWQRRDTGAKTRPLGTIGAAFAVLLMAAALLLTGSKGGMIAAVPVIMVLAFTLPRPGTALARRARLLAVGVVLVGLITALVVPTIRVRILSAFTTQRRSAAFRYYTWRGTMDMIRERPVLGFGPGSYQYAYPRFARAGFTGTAHQTPLQIAAETGVLSLVLLLGAVVAIIVCLRGQLQRAPPDQRALAAAALAGFVGFWVHNLVDYSWYVPAVGVTVWALVGMAMAAERSREPVGASARLTIARFAAAVALLVGVCLLGVGLYSQALAGRAGALRVQGMAGAATGQVRRAIALDSLDADLHADLAAYLAAQAKLTGRTALQEGIAAQQQAVALAPTKPSLHRQLANLYAQTGDLPAAIASAREAVALYPNYDRGWISLAQLQEMAGDVEAALASYQRVTQLYFSPVRKYAAIEEMAEPGYAYAWRAVGLHALEMGDNEYASFALGLAAKVLKVYFEQVPLRRELMKLVGRWDEGQHRALRLMAAEVAERLRALAWPMGLLRAGELYIALEEPATARRVLAQLCELGQNGPLASPLERLIVGRGCVDLAALIEAAGAPADAEQAHKHGASLLGLGLSRVDSQTVPLDWEDDDMYVVRYMLRHGEAPPLSAQILLVTGGKR